MSTLRAANLFFETLKPWEMRKQPDKDSDLNVVLNLTMDTLRKSAIILKPIIPILSDNLLNKLNIPNDERNWSNLLSGTNETHSLSKENVTLFKRIIITDNVGDDKEKKIKHRRKV